MRPASEILSSADFDRITDLAWRTCGIDLKNGKRELVQARLGKKIRQGNFGSFKDYYDHVVADTTGEELTGLLDALTTNFTSFLREAAHFDLLRKTIVPGIRGEIRIWSAACSTGEEPWTIAFSLLEELGSSAAGRIQILASDISSRALAIAERGAYEAERFERPACRLAEQISPSRFGSLGRMVSRQALHSPHGRVPAFQPDGNVPPPTALPRRSFAAM